MEVSERERESEAHVLFYLFHARVTFARFSAPSNIVAGDLESCLLL